MADERAVSVTLSYTLAVAISVVLATGMVIAVGDQVDQRQQAVAREQLEVAGGRLAAGIEAADELAVGSAGTVTISVSLPERVAGSSYRVEVDAGPSTSTLRLVAPGATADVRTRFANRTAVTDTTVPGGDLEVVLTPTGTLEVRRP